MSKSIKEILDEINLELEISSGYSYEFHDILMKAANPSNLMLDKYKSMLDQTKDPTKQRILKDMITKEQGRLAKEQEEFAAKASQDKEVKQKTAAEEAQQKEQLKNTRMLSSPEEWDEQKAMESIVEDPSMAAQVAAQRRQNTLESFKQKYPKIFADKQKRKEALQNIEDTSVAEKEKSKHYDQGVKQFDPENRPVHATKKRGAARIIQMGDRKGAMDRKLINREQGVEAKPEYKNTISTDDALNIKQIMSEPKKTQENPERNLKAEIQSLKAARARLSSAKAPVAPTTTPTAPINANPTEGIKKSSDNFDCLVDKLNNLKKGMMNSGLGGAGSVKAGAVLPNKVSIPKTSNNSAASKVKMPGIAPQSNKDPMRSIAQTQNKDIKDIKMKEAHAQFGGQVLKVKSNGQWDLEKRCWEGYEPVPGKKTYSDNSCKPIKKKECECDSKVENLDKGVKSALAGLATVAMLGSAVPAKAQQPEMPYAVPGTNITQVKNTPQEKVQFRSGTEESYKNKMRLRQTIGNHLTALDDAGKLNGDRIHMQNQYIQNPHVFNEHYPGVLHPDLLPKP
jgi:hypothetical protein